MARTDDPSQLIILLCVHNIFCSLLLKEHFMCQRYKTIEPKQPRHWTKVWWISVNDFFKKRTMVTAVKVFTRVYYTNTTSSLILFLLTQDKCSFENSVDPDQLASVKKSADQDLHCFPFSPRFSGCRLTGQKSEIGISYSFNQQGRGWFQMTFIVSAHFTMWMLTKLTSLNLWFLYICVNGIYLQSLILFLI